MNTVFSNAVYSIYAKLGGGGIGNTAFYAARGLYHAGLLQQLFVSSNAQDEIPHTLVSEWGFLGRVAKYVGFQDKTERIDLWTAQLFDRWVAAQMPRAQIFHGWNGSCLTSLHKAKKEGMITIVERPSSHPLTATQLMQEEYARWGVPNKPRTVFLAPTIAEIEQADYITVPSPFARDSMLQHNVPRQKLIEIPFGVNLHRYTPGRVTTATERPFRAVFVGNISILKGIPDLLEAWHMLNWPNAELWLVGGATHDFQNIQNRWQNLRGVVYKGFSRNISEMLQQCDIFVFPSITEGSALVTYEAMACGLPVIASHNAGSVVRDGIDGFLVPIRDPAAIALAMTRLREEAGLRLDMGKAARAHVENYSWDTYGHRLAAAYRKISGDPTAENFETP